MTATKPTLADTLSRLRAKSGLSVRQLEDASGVARSVISRLEHGEYLRPSPSTLTRLATALDVEASELLTVAGYTASQAEALPTIGVYLRTKYGHLPADSRQQLAEFLDQLETDQKVKRSRGRKPKR